MKVSMPRTRRGAVLTAAVAVTVVSGGWGITAIAASSDPQIHGCVSSGVLGLGKGSIRIVSNTSQCTSGESALSWNQQGLPGPTGATGPQGPVGPAGDAGASEAWASSVPAARDVKTATAADGFFLSIAGWDLPAGSYLLNGATTAFVSKTGTASYQLRCSIRSAGHELNWAEVPALGLSLAPESSPVGVQTSVTLTETTHVDFGCKIDSDAVNNSGTVHADVARTTLQATRVNVLHGQ